MIFNLNVSSQIVHSHRVSLNNSSCSPTFDRRRQWRCCFYKNPQKRMRWELSICLSAAQKNNQRAVSGKVIQFPKVLLRSSHLICFCSSHLKMHLKGKYPLKNSVEIKTMIDQRTNGTISLEESSDIVGYMYNKDDSSHIMQ